MSYLNALRLHFAGKFQANVSTVNNDAGHFDSGRFKPEYQEMQSDGRHWNGWFNPKGDAAWRLLGCRVTGISMPDGTSGSDPVLNCLVGDSDSQVCAKMVDLDPMQQLVSQIWGLQVRITDSQGNTLFRGDFDPAAFMDIWDRATGKGDGGDMNAGATYQSVLTNLWWGDVSGSPFLSALKESAAGGLLSIKFNLDGVNADFTAPDFMCGRIVGTIGPASAAEPRHLVLGRQFVAAAGRGNFFTPLGQINFFPGRVCTTTNTLFLDLGNALSTQSPAGPLNDLGDLTVTANGVPLGVIPSQGAGGYAGDPSWYSSTAGVVALPLSAEQMAAVAASPIQITGAKNATGQVAITESPTGAFLRADNYVYRMSPNDDVVIPVYATLWGNPLEGAVVDFTLDASLLQGGSQCQPLDCPDPGTPTSPSEGGPSFSASDTTDAHGIARLSVLANDLGLVRTFKDGSSIDGQVYGIRPSFADPNLQGNSALINQWNFVSFLMWSRFNAPSPVTWEAIQPIMQQYANLYPIMLQFLNLGNRASVQVNTRSLQAAFGLDPANPNSMPVTRDLSPAKRRAILDWLANPQPPITEATPALPARPAAATPVTLAPALEALTSPRGGKSAAMTRRIGASATHRPRRAQIRIRPKVSATEAPSTELDVVKDLLQQAIMLEHATIPVYLYALYSLEPSKNAMIAQIIQSVVIEEMLHMTLACNVLNALGGSPTIDSPDFIPTYPGHLPGGVESSLVVHLRPFSLTQLDTFLDIEQPDDPFEFRSLLAAEEGMTIGDFYRGIEEKIVALGNEAFVPGPRNQIGPDQMENSVVVTDVASALQAINTIVEQGEGTTSTPKEVVGKRYAHYYRFMQIKKGRLLVQISTTGPVETQFAYVGPPVPFDPSGVYAAPDDPLSSTYPAGSQQAALNNRFNYTYTALLRSLHTTFNGAPDNLGTSIGLMMSLKGQARDMMSGIPNPSVITGPSFQYKPTDPSPV